MSLLSRRAPTRRVCRGAIAVAACTPTRTASLQIDDNEIHLAVKARLTTARFSNIVNIDINVTNGVVTLAGEVPNAPSRQTPLPKPARSRASCESTTSFRSRPRPRANAPSSSLDGGCAASRGAAPFCFPAPCLYSVPPPSSGAHEASSLLPEGRKRGSATSRPVER